MLSVLAQFFSPTAPAQSKGNRYAMGLAGAPSAHEPHQRIRLVEPCFQRVSQSRWWMMPIRKSEQSLIRHTKLDMVTEGLVSPMPDLAQLLGKNKEEEPGRSQKEQG